MKYDQMVVNAGTESRSPCGERGLKFRQQVQQLRDAGRSPCGERGLKWDRRCNPPAGVRSLPVRGAWVEMIAPFAALMDASAVAPRAGSVG